MLCVSNDKTWAGFGKKIRIETSGISVFRKECSQGYVLGLTDPWDSRVIGIGFSDRWLKSSLVDLCRV